ncbi:MULTISPECIES: hypothetical protein [unclassified Streptomyces]|uniref:hypothetical protein n=1 Tax=unclassified Streptomyces TaxID=2593676 RepID=UPI00342CEF83
MGDLRRRADAWQDQDSATAPGAAARFVRGPFTTGPGSLGSPYARSLSLPENRF